MERVGEEVRQEAAFRVAHAGDVGNHAQRRAVTDRSDDGVEPKLVEAFHVRLGADPLVAEEHHRLLAGGVRLVDEFLDVRSHERGQERNPVTLCLARYAPGGVVAAFVHEILGAQPVAVQSLEVVERLRRHGACAPEPVDNLLAVPLVEDERELVEERREPHHIGLRIVFEPLFECAEHEVARRRMVDVERDLVFLVSPVVRQMVVHLDRVPDDVGEERDRVFVHRLRFADRDRVVPGVEIPAVRVDHLPGRAVDGLPVAMRVRVAVRLQLFGVEPFH